MLKSHVQHVVNNKLAKSRAQNNTTANPFDIYIKAVSNLIERRGECSKDLFNGFYLKYLTPQIRQVVWRGLLSDGLLLRQVIKNKPSLKSPSVATNKNMLMDIQSVLKGDYHTMNIDNLHFLAHFKSVLVNFQGHLDLEEIPYNQYYLLLPIEYVFQDLYLSGRDTQIMVYLVSLVEKIMKNQIIPSYQNFDMQVKG